jgi:hypothetical protein
VGRDVTVTVRRLRQGVYAFDPFPFNRSGVEIPCAGRLLSPQPEGTDMPAAIAAAPREVEVITLVETEAS